MAIVKLPAGYKSPYVRERQSDAISKAETKDATTSTMTSDDLENRKAHIDMWLADTFETIKVLIEIYRDLLPQFVADSEVHSGIRSMITICNRVCDRLQPELDKFGEAKAEGMQVAHDLRDALFPEVHKGPLAALKALRGLGVYIAHIEGCLVALNPTSQAVWDGKFIDAVTFAQAETERMHDWVKQQIKVRAPQTLLVPAKTD